MGNLKGYLKKLVDEKVAKELSSHYYNLTYSEKEEMRLIRKRFEDADWNIPYEEAYKGTSLRPGEEILEGSWPDVLQDIYHIYSEEEKIQVLKEMKKEL